MNLQLKQLRKAAHMTQEELADRLGVTKRVIGTWERQDTQITLADACAVSTVFDCTPNDLCGWYIDHPSDRPRPAPADPYEAELVESYRCMDRIARMTVVETVRGQAALSASRGERVAAAPEVRAAGE